VKDGFEMTVVLVTLMCVVIVINVGNAMELEFDMMDVQVL
jgi:hypothetical protein